MHHTPPHKDITQKHKDFDRRLEEGGGQRTKPPRSIPFSSTTSDLRDGSCNNHND